MTTYATIADLVAAKDQPLPPGPWLLVTQQMIDQFAELTGDKQWIHTDPARATLESPFGKTIAHGFMSLSMLSKMLEDMITVESVKMGMNYGLEKVRFPYPLPVDTRIRLHAGVLKVEDQASGGTKVYWQCQVEGEGLPKPVSVGVFITLFFE